MAFTNMHSNDFASSAAVSVANSSVTSTTAGCGQLLRYLHPVPDRYQPCQLLRCCSFHHSGCTCSYIYSSTCPCTVSLGDCTADGIGTASDGAPARRTGQGLTFPYRCQSRLAMRCEGITRNPGHFFRACQKQVHPKKYANILARYRRINALQLGTSAGDAQ